MSYGASINRSVPARRHLRGQDSERRQARRSSRGAADEVRVGDQSQSSQADRPDDSAECAGESGQGDQMTEVGDQKSDVRDRKSSDGEQ